MIANLTCCCVCSLPYTHIADDSEYLDWVKIAVIVPDDNNGFNFIYQPGESDETVWQGNQVLNIVVDNC